ncbi:hypothetical protein MSSIT_1313 [Methanosarcina siciliae T4/M]|uniref:DUF1638 domain-containing protein n=1 Tax=Methanosarcina siciliae T4/M TaxID=1434120 RepID=A0A0E3P3A2_9EURY|nr:DUF1638 domain-containing protein [Methanosarcina siciliae]AKB28032.1 hypothetical protein MSSIT_1313 [Methanosarcina siciliae T4/M]
MPVLSIIACGMLEDELVHVLSKDCELKQLIVVENRNNLGFLRKLRAGKCIPRTIPLDRVQMFFKTGCNPDFETLAKFLAPFPLFGKVCEKMNANAGQQISVVVNLLRLGLHADLELLKSEVYRNIREMAAFSDGILIFYGTCGHVLGELEKDFIDLGCPLFFLKDKAGEIVEDCISTALGGNEAYARAMLACRGKGTIYLTPMWASSWKNFEKESGSRDLNNRYLKNSRYCLAVKIETGISYEPGFSENIQEFARTFGMNTITLKGSSEIAEQGYSDARKIMVKNPGRLPKNHQDPVL